MATRYAIVDHDTPMLLPPDLRDWVPANHMVRFIMEAVQALNLDKAHVNGRGSGSAQYPPGMMLGLLVYSYSTGTFSSRKIEQLTYDSVPVRFLCADNHPDHASICKFRTDNKALLESGMHQILECAARAKILKVGNVTLAVDGTKIMANASKHSAMSHGHAVGLMKLLREEIGELLAKAEDADATPLRDGLSIPDEIKRREDRVAKIQEAVRAMEERAKERHAEERAEYEQKLKERAGRERATGKKTPGPAPQPPKEEGPREKDQYNFTDPESRIMKAGGGDNYVQGYNAQAAVEVESRLIVACRVTEAANDKEQLVPTLQACHPAIKGVAAVLTDSGYYSEAAVKAVEGDMGGAFAEAKVYAATKRGRHGWSVKDMERKEEPAGPAEGASATAAMDHRLSTREGKELYALRKQTVEPVFGIIKSAIGFRAFMLRGLAKVGLEWTLVGLSYNLKRLFHMGANLQAA